MSGRHAAGRDARALLFDFDGTIVDTETPALTSAQDVFAEHGVELPMEWWLSGMGTNRKASWVSELERLTGRSFDAEELLRQRRVEKDRITDTQPVLPGVMELIDAAESAGLLLGVASSSPHEWVDRHLERVGLLHRFQVVSCRDDVDEVAKPAPDVYLHALAALGANPSTSGAIEDSPHGASAARAAGLRCCVVPNPLMVDTDFHGVDVKLSRLDDLPSAELLDLLTS